MPVCTECDSPLDIDEDDVDEGEVVVCDECGAEYEIVSVDPLEISGVEEGYEDDEEEAAPFAARGDDDDE